MTRKRGGDIKVAIAGAYTLDPALVAKHVLLGEQGLEGWGGLRAVPIGTKVLLRRPLSGPAGPVEQIVADLCGALSIEVEWRSPEPGMGGAGTIRRDERMVQDADAVVTYVDTRRKDEGGTVRLTRMAMYYPRKAVWSFAPVEHDVRFAGASEQSLPAWA